MLTSNIRYLPSVSIKSKNSHDILDSRACDTLVVSNHVHGHINQFPRLYERRCRGLKEYIERNHPRLREEWRDVFPNLESVPNFDGPKETYDIICYTVTE
jgi:hypothetical protein